MQPETENWFKTATSLKWKAGKVVAQDGKVLFIKYGNFLRRVPLDFIVPAEQHADEDCDEVDPEDVKNCERLLDDDFKDLEIIAQKNAEIKDLKKVIENLQNTQYKSKIEPTTNMDEPVSKKDTQIKPSSRMKTRQQSSRRLENNEHEECDTQSKSPDMMETNNMLADALTKKVGNQNWIKAVLESNVLRKGEERNKKLELHGGD